MSIFIKALTLTILVFNISLANARENIRGVGSSTVYPFTTAVADKFKIKYPSKPSPVIASTGTGGGFKLFCAGVGLEHPDFVNASRPIKSSERKLCAQNGVSEILEIKIGMDAIVLFSSPDLKLNLTSKDIFLALAEKIPAKDGALIANPHKTWKDVNPSLPNVKIEVYGPPSTSGTRDSFLELAMEKGAQELGLDKKIAHMIRADGWIDSGENDSLVIQKVQSSKGSVGIAGYSYYKQFGQKLNTVSINGVDPLASLNGYDLSRPLFVYVKVAHIKSVDGMREFLEELTSRQTLGDRGYLAKLGLIPLAGAEISGAQKTVKDAVAK